MEAEERQKDLGSQQVESQVLGEIERADVNKLTNGVKHEEANKPQSIPQHGRVTAEPPGSVESNDKKVKPVEFGSGVVWKRRAGLRLRGGDVGVAPGKGWTFGDLELSQELKPGEIQTKYGEVIHIEATNPAVGKAREFPNPLNPNGNIPGSQRPVFGSTVSPPEQQQQQSSPEHDQHREPPSVTTPPPSAVTVGVSYHERTQSSSHTQNKVSEMNVGGRPYPTPESPFFPNGHTGLGGVPPPPLPLPPLHHNQPHPEHPQHHPEPSPSPVDTGGRYRVPHQLPYPLHMFPPPPIPFIHHPPHFHHYPYPSHPYAYPEPTSTRPMTADGPTTHTPTAHHFQYPQYPLQDFRPPSSHGHSHSGSSGHLSPFPPPSFPYSLPYPQNVFPYRLPPSPARPVESDAYRLPLPSSEPSPPFRDQNIPKFSGDFLEQFAKAKWADLRMKVIFPPKPNDTLWHEINIPFHSLVAARVGVLASALEDGKAIAIPDGREVMISLDNILRDDGGVMGTNAKWTMTSLGKFLTEIAVVIALASAYGCGDDTLGKWVEMNEPTCLNHLLDGVSQIQTQAEEQNKPLPACREGAARGDRSAAPSPEPVSVGLTVNGPACDPPAPKCWADYDDTEDEDEQDELKLEPASDDTQVTTPHQEGSPQKDFTGAYDQAPGSCQLAPDNDSPLTRILSLLVAAVLLDIPNTIDFSLRRLQLYMDCPDGMAAGIEMLGTILHIGHRDSLPPLISSNRFIHVDNVLYHFFSTALKEVTRRCLNRLARVEELEEKDRWMVRELPFETVARAVLGVVGATVWVGVGMRNTVGLVRRLLVEERGEKGVVVGVFFGSGSGTNGTDESVRFRFGEFQGTVGEEKVLVGRRVGGRWVWIET